MGVTSLVRNANSVTYMDKNITHGFLAPWVIPYFSDLKQILLFFPFLVKCQNSLLHPFPKFARRHSLLFQEDAVKRSEAVKSAVKTHFFDTVLTFL